MLYSYIVDIILSLLIVLFVYIDMISVRSICVFYYYNNNSILSNLFIIHVTMCNTYYIVIYYIRNYLYYILYVFYKGAFTPKISLEISCIRSHWILNFRWKFLMEILIYHNNVITRNMIHGIKY